ncbi:MAG: hypothetical protein M3R65_00485 [Gemmatimonadota bacterium]|nr:hypothetical protein [Gemmatimonadota bacterium]
MLAYLDALCAALLARHSIEIYRLLALPQARQLPRTVREEATVIAKAGPTSHIAPIQSLHLFYKLSHLVDESTDLDEPDRVEPEPQMEIRFGVRKVG